jgi:L-alanine-DL-glutamate epimerase-like enolase superfamily enzyme
VSPQRIARVELRRLALPLITPYRLSYHTFESFEPILARVFDQDGRQGFGEAHISPGSSTETREGGWAFCADHARALPGLQVGEAAAAIAERGAESPVAATALVTALEMLADHPLLRVVEEQRLPVLTPTNATDAAGIEAEVEARLAEGFRTFKVKVGRDLDADLARVAAYQRALAGRGALRLDANRAFDREQGCRFGAALDPDGIELFEQPCPASDWTANAAVAAASAVPLMLDEAICSLADIERAGTLARVAFCKLKLKRFGSLGALETALRAVREHGMEPVLGDGLSAEPGCWMEACVARATIGNAGEFNGFLKPRDRLFEIPLRFEDGSVVLEPGTPRLRPARLEALTREKQVLASSGD